MSISERVVECCANVIPFAYMKDGTRVPPNKEEWDDAMERVCGMVMGIVEKAYRDGYIKAAVEYGFREMVLDEVGVETEAKFLSEREFRSWRDSL